MEKERPWEVKQRGVSSAKRQQRALSGHVTTHAFSASALDRRNDREIRGGEADGEMGSGGGSEGEEAFRPATAATATTNISLGSRKRVKFNGEVLEDSSPVDPAMVPRRSRSVINKRSSQSASPLLSDAKKSNRQPSYLNGVRQQRQNMFNDQITKDEVEVAVALSTLASVVLVSKSVENREDKRMSKENLETEVPASYFSEAAKEETMKLTLACNGTKATKLSSHVEGSLEETAKAETSVKEQPITASVIQKINQESAQAVQTATESTTPIKDGWVENTSSSDGSRKLSDPSGASSEAYPVNGMLQPAQLHAFSVSKTVLGLWPFGSASMGHGVHSVKHKSNDCAQFISQEGAADQSSVLPYHTHGLSTMPSSSKAAPGSDTFASAARPRLNKTGLTTEKLQPASADGRKSWTRCVTHVYISHLIQNHQNSEKKCQLLPCNQLRIKEAANCGVQTANEVGGLRNGLNSVTSAGANGFVMDRNLHEARIQMVQDGRLLQVQQASTLSATYAQQKHGCDFLALSATDETRNSAGELNSPGQLSIPYMHSQVQHHAILPFPFIRGPCTSPCPDQLAIAASQQLQLPHYIGSPFYGQHMLHGGGTSMQQQQQQQQQQMWQVHMVHCRPQLGIPKWQNGRPLDPTLIPCAQPSSAIPPAPPIELVGSWGACHPPRLQQHQHLSIPALSSSSQAKQQHLHQDGSSRLGPEVPTHLQLLCHAQHI